MITLHEIYSQSHHLNNIQTEKFPSHLNKRFCSMGRGRRFESFNDYTSPGPGKYNPTDFSKSKIVKFPKGPRELLTINSDSPGPGHYNLPKIKGPSFSFAQKLQEKPNCNPGPGEYELINTKSRPKAAIFGSETRKDNFLNPELSRNPEPWKYNIKYAENTPKWKFSSEARDKEIDFSKLGVFEALNLAKGQKSKILSHTSSKLQ